MDKSVENDIRYLLKALLGSCLSAVEKLEFKDRIVRYVRVFFLKHLCCSPSKPLTACKPT